MKSPLPKLTRQCFLCSEWKRKLIFRTGSFLSPQPARHSLLQNLHHRGRRTARWLTQQKMNVIRHHNISDQKKTVAISNLSKYFCKYTSGPNRAKQRQPPIAGARQKMQIVFAVISFQVFGHEYETAKPHPLRAAKDGPPPGALSYSAVNTTSGIIGA